MNKELKDKYLLTPSKASLLFECETNNLELRDFYPFLARYVLRIKQPPSPRMEAGIKIHNFLYSFITAGGELNECAFFMKNKDKRTKAYKEELHEMKKHYNDYLIFDESDRPLLESIKRFFESSPLLSGFWGADFEKVLENEVFGGIVDVYKNAVDRENIKILDIKTTSSSIQNIDEYTKFKFYSLAFQQIIYEELAGIRGLDNFSFLIIQTVPPFNLRELKLNLSDVGIFYDILKRRLVPAYAVLKEKMLEVFQEETSENSSLNLEKFIEMKAYKPSTVMRSSLPHWQRQNLMRMTSEIEMERRKNEKIKEELGEINEK